MKPRLRPMCRPSTPLSARANGALEDRRLFPLRTLPRRGCQAPNGACTSCNLRAPNETSAIRQCLLGADSPIAPQTQDLAGATLLRNLQPGLEQLPAKQRDVLVLVWLEEMSYDQAAGILGISVPTVTSRLNRALEQLHRWLASADSPPPSIN